ncbi:hypothetical protein AgCh_016363 [Apium graveolens]
MVGVVGWNSVNVEKQVEEATAATAAVGLRILVQHVSLQNKYCSELSSINVVVKSCNLGSGKSSFSFDDNYVEEEEDYDNQCYSIKSCWLCKKKLRADKDVYMYKGDQGFCSVECRDRQIYLDDISDLEASTKRLVSSYLLFSLLVLE